MKQQHEMTGTRMHHRGKLARNQVSWDWKGAKLQ